MQPGAANPVQPDPAAVTNGGGTGTGGSPSGAMTPGGTTPTPAPAAPTAAVRRLAARFSLPKSARVHRKVVFDAGKSTAASARIVSYAWTFGDGHKAKGRKVSHKYAKPGTYTITLTVRDAAGHKATLRHRLKVRR